VIVLSTQRWPPPAVLEPGTYDNLTVCEADTTAAGKCYNPYVLKAVREWARDCDIVHVHGSWRYHLLAAAKASREYGIPYIIRPAGNLGLLTARHRWYLKRPYFWLFERRAFNGAAAIHCTSTLEMKELEGLKIRARKFVVPNPVEIVPAGRDDSGSELNQAFPALRQQHKVILSLCRLSWKKRLDVLLDAFIQLAPEFPEWRLILAGTQEDPRIAAQLRVTADAKQIADRVFFFDTVNGNLKNALFARAQVFALPSLHENFGVSVAEALAHGVPCVVSSGVALSSDVAEAKAGLVSESDAVVFAKSLRSLMGDDALRARLASGAQQLARRYQPDSIAAQLDLQYQICLDQMRRAASTSIL
jgi:glycosyltransferase involved in cell wall biosynthesis